MPLEIEAKIKVDSLEPSAERLRKAGACFVAEQRQSDVYYVDADDRLARCGSGLRLRNETVAGNTASILTFKGPRQSGPYKIRPEYETPVADAEAMVKILEGLGFRASLTVVKTRRMWEFGGCQVCLDHVEPLGFFVEVEGPDEAAIRTVLTRIGLADRPQIIEGYAAMLSRRQQT